MWKHLQTNTKVSNIIGIIPSLEKANIWQKCVTCDTKVIQKQNSFVNIKLEDKAVMMKQEQFSVGSLMKFIVHGSTKRLVYDIGNSNFTK